MSREELEEKIYKELFLIIDIFETNGLSNTAELKHKINSKCVRGNFGYFFIRELREILLGYYGVLKEKNYDYFNDHPLTLSVLPSVEKFIKDNWLDMSDEDKKNIFHRFSKIYNYSIKY